MADTGLSSFVAGLAGNTRVPQVSNDAFYNQIIQNNINEKRLKEARAYQEQQTEKAMKYQKELLWERQAAELEAGRNAQLSQWVNTNMPLVNRKDKKSVEQYNKDYEMMRKQIWSKNGKLEYMPEEEKPKGKGFGGLGKFLLGEKQGERLNEATAEAFTKLYQNIGEEYTKSGVVGIGLKPLTTSIKLGTPAGQLYSAGEDILSLLMKAKGTGEE
jgi:hypothetical protein